MTYVPPPSRATAVAEIAGVLARARRVLLTTHLNADGDGVGSQVALAAWLRARGREGWLVNPTPFPDSYAFLLPDAGWAVDPASNRARELVAGADLAVVLDTGEVPRIGRVGELLRGLPTVVVDHHPPGDDPIAGLALRDPQACATGELLFDVLCAAGGPWPPAVALGLYVAILTDTGSFRFSNSTPAAHRIVAALLEAGVDPEDTHRRVYGSHPLSRLRLLHAALGELVVDPEGLLAWMTVPTDAYQSLGASSDDLEGLANYPREVHGVEAGLLFREPARGGTKISFRANGEVDVNALARRFGGGGHVKAAGAMVERPLVEVREEVVAATLEAIRAARRERVGS